MLRRNIIFGFLGQAGLLVLSLISTRLIFKELGADVLGIINFAVIGTAFLILFADMGIAPTITREVAAHRNNDSKYTNDLISTMSLLGWILFFITSLIAVLLSPLAVQDWLKIEAINQSSAILALQIIAISLLLSIPRSVYGSFINGCQRVDYWNVANLLFFGLQQLGMIVVLMFGGKLLQVALWYALSAFIGLVPFIIISSKLVGGKSLMPKYYPGIFKRNLSFASRIVANSFFAYLVTQIDRWTISRLLPVSLLGYYGFAQGLVSKGAIVPGAITNAAFPALSQSTAENDRTLWISQYNKLQDFCCYLYVPVSAAVAMLGIVVIKYVFDQETARLMSLPLLFLSVGQLLFGILSVPSWLAIAMKKLGILVKTNMLALIIVVPVTILLTYKFGLQGAAFSAIIYGVWQFVYFVPRFCSECLRISPSIWYMRNLLFMGMGIGIYGFIWFLTYIIGQSLTVGGLVIGYFSGTIIFAVVGWFSIGEEIKTAIIRLYKETMLCLKMRKEC